jgi:N-acetylmuramoyl-L-alanine amidase
VPSPDRIFFDLHGTKLSSELFGKSIDVDDGFLKKIRVAQYQKGLTRIVLEVAPVSQYSAFFLPNPSRLIIDVHGRDATPAPVTAAKAETLTPAATQPVTAARTSAALVAPVQPAAYSSSKPAKAAIVNTPSDTMADMPKKPAENSPTIGLTASIPTSSGPEKAAARDPELDALTTGHTTTSPTFEAVTPAPAADPAPPVRSARKPVDELSVVGREARPDADGERTLIRALGLKIGKIVVDAGHGGHDTGTIGPSGLWKKTSCSTLPYA